MIAACPLPWPRGTPIRIHRMASALVDRGHDVHVVTYPLGDYVRSIPYSIHRVGRGIRRLDHRPGPSFTKLFYLDPLIGLRIRHMLDSGQFDLIHAHHYEGMLASLFARRSSQPMPIVYDAHTLLESELPFYASWFPSRVLARAGRILDYQVPRRADHIIAVTDRMAHWFESNAAVAPDSVSVIPNGVEHEHFGDNGGGALPNPGKPRIMFAGNLASYQGIAFLLEAFVHIRAAVPNAELILVAGRPPESLLERLDKLGITASVFFEDPDYTSLPARLASAHVLVNPRIDCHGIPQKLLNYMASGRPIVSFASSSALLEHERDGLIVADGDTVSLANAVLRLVRDTDLADSLGRAARNKVVADHSWDSVAERVEVVYERVTGQNQ